MATAVVPPRQLQGTRGSESQKDHMKEKSEGPLSAFPVFTMFTTYWFP